MQAPAPVTHGADGEMDLASALAALRRRWPLLVILPALAGLAAWMYSGTLPDTYTSEVLLRKAGADEVLSSWTSQIGQEPVQAQFEIIRSRAVLGPVVDSMGFRLALADEDVPETAVFSDRDVEERAPRGSFRLERADDGTIVLVNAVTDRVIDRARPGGVFAGPGFTFSLHPQIGSGSLPLDFRIMHRESAIRSLRGRVRLDRVPETDLITVSFTDGDPELAAAVVAAVAASYQNHSGFVALQEAVRRREFLERELASAATALRSAQEQMLVYQVSSGAVDPTLEGTSRITLLMEGEQELRNLSYQEGTLAALNQALDRGEPSDDILRRAVVLGPDVLPTAPALYNRLQDLKGERARLTASRFGLTEEGAQVQVIDSLMSNVRSELRQIAEHSLAGVRQRRAGTERRIAELRSAVASVPARSGELGRLLRDVEAAERRHDLLLGTYFEAQLAEAVETGDIEILDPAVVPVIPNPSNRGRTVFLALFLGTVAAAGIAFLLEFTDRRVRDSEQAEEATGAPVLASIPRFKYGGNGTGARPILDSEHRSASTEAFRSLRTMLRFSSSRGSMGIVAVTSAEPGEGKSVVAANLSTTMAADHSRVLLIDADFPRPVQHQTFGETRSPGLTDVLTGEATLADAVRFNERYHVHVLPAGSAMMNSAELLSGAEFRRLILQLAREYDTIIVDTPPVLAIADTMAIATVAEAMLLVARENTTNRRALRRAATQIRNVGATLTGVVLNDVASPAAYAQYYGASTNGTSTQKRSALNRLRSVFRTPA